TQSVFARIDNDFGEMFEAVANEKIGSYELIVNPEQCCTVILVSGGYPESYEKGKTITGLESVKGSLLVHAGTKRQDGTLVTSGGRVMAITSFGDSLQDALSKSLNNAEKVDFEGKYYRKDIGQDLLKLSQ
ncbi:MAG: phosphoribosylglycinamide synthetase C domain-containing protein, partial [Flavobacteriales bacterium]